MGNPYTKALNKAGKDEDTSGNGTKDQFVPEGELPWEKQKNQDYRKKLIRHSKHFLIMLLILVVITLAMTRSSYELEDESGFIGYEISILSTLKFLWIIVFTIYLAQAVPIFLLMGINKFVGQLRGAGPKEEKGPDKDPETGSEDTDDPASGRTATEMDENGDEDNNRDPDSGGRETHDGDSEEDPNTDGSNPKEEEKKEKKRKLMAIPFFAGIAGAGIDEDSSEAGRAESLIFNFFHHTIIIVGFAYAFLTLGLELGTTVEFLGSDITAESILNAVLTGLITVVFVVYFLPPFLTVLINSFLRSYAKRAETKEERVHRIKAEVDKVRPGLQKTLVYLIILFAALIAISYIDCHNVESDDSDDSSTQDPHYDPYDPPPDSSSESEPEDPELCEYLETAEVIIRSLIILMAALLLTTVIPLFVYLMSTSPDDARKKSMYKVGRYLNYLILIFAMFIIMNLAGIDLGASISFGESQVTLWSVISAFVVLVLSHLVAKMICAILRDTALNPQQMEEHASVIMEKLIYFVILLIGIAVAMGTLGINILAIATGLGLLAFALAFGMQDTIANFMAGIMIAIERPFQIGDRVRVGDEWGDVIDIGMRSTKIRTVKNETVLIPNALVATNEVWNYTKDSPVIANVIDIGISYDSDPELAERIILDIATQHPLVIPNPAPSVRMKEYAESSIDLQLWAWIGNARKREIVKSDLLKAIRKQFVAQGIEIPYPHRTLTFKSGAAKELADAIKNDSD